MCVCVCVCVYITLNLITYMTKFRKKISSTGVPVGTYDSIYLKPCFLIPSYLIIVTHHFLDRLNPILTVTKIVYIFNCFFLQLVSL